MRVVHMYQEFWCSMYFSCMLGIHVHVCMYVCIDMHGFKYVMGLDSE